MDAIPRTRLVLSLTAAIGLAATALAQPPGGGFGGPGGFRGGPGGPGGGPGGGIGGLLRSPEVRDELELLDDQIEELRDLERDLQDQMRDTMRSLFTEMRESGVGREGMREAMQTEMQNMQAEAEEALGEVLTTQQLERLKEINTQQMIQRGGGRGLMGGPLAEELGLTDEQIEQLRERSRELQEELRRKAEEDRAEAQEELLSLLTSEQREKLESMMGEPFALSQPARGPGDRGDRGGLAAAAVVAALVAVPAAGVLAVPRSRRMSSDFKPSG